jgi:hypothetical protein
MPSRLCILRLLFSYVFTTISVICLNITLESEWGKSVFVNVHAMNIYHCLLVSLKKCWNFLSAPKYPGQQRQCSVDFE